MIVETRVISSAEATFVLRVKLGNLRNWRDFLSDNIRNKQHIKGSRLLPCARRRERGMMRPVYAVHEVEAFITDVLAKVPHSGRDTVKPSILAIESGRNWRFNLFDEDGTPETLH